ncbi:MAG TPA: hypothetical protein VGQ57_02005 [Polyangiaceae bacterium]|jgi:hypothetical protein|nr:hypothetical protein [Polyangiaceae bacterium]
MSSHGVIVPFPRRRSVGRRWRDEARQVLGEFVAFERTHARLAWSVTLVGLAIGLALKNL